MKDYFPRANVYIIIWQVQPARTGKCPNLGHITLPTFEIKCHLRLQTIVVHSGVQGPWRPREAGGRGGRPGCRRPQQAHGGHGGGEDRPGYPGLRGLQAQRGLPRERGQLASNRRPMGADEVHLMLMQGNTTVELFFRKISRLFRNFVFVRFQNVQQKIFFAWNFAAKGLVILFKTKTGETLLNHSYDLT